jgi:hypothetical protein
MATIRYSNGPTRVNSKDPDSVLDYQFDWSSWLGADTIASVTFSVDGGLTEDSSINDDTSATIWLSGGESGRSYKVVCSITTSGGRKCDRTMIVPVQEM